MVTETCGGASVGNCAIGKVGITAEPARMISNAQTVAKTGRFIKKSTNIQKRTSEDGLRASDFRPRTSDTDHHPKHEHKLLIIRWTPAQQIGEISIPEV